MQYRIRLQYILSRAILEIMIGTFKAELKFLVSLTTPRPFAFLGMQLLNQPKLFVLGKKKIIEKEYLLSL
jgi:hypothetical protein